MIDADGDVLDILVQTRRNAKAAKRLFQRLVSQFGEPRVVITDKLRSYIRPVKTQASNADYRAHKGLGSGLILSQSQKITVAASAIAEKKAFGQRS